MGIVFHAASGSPYAWRVWLALEHKAVDYELRLRSLSAGEMLSAEFVAINPRHKVPVLVDDGWVISESAAIVEYLEDRFPAGPPLFPGDARLRGTVRRIVREIDEYLEPPGRRLMRELWFKPRDDWDLQRIEHEAAACRSELAGFERTMQGDYLAGPLSAADYALYPRLAFLLRLDRSLPSLAFEASLPAGLVRWMARIEALPCFDRAYPPHWRQPGDAAAPRGGRLR